MSSEPHPSGRSVAVGRHDDLRRSRGVMSCVRRGRLDVGVGRSVLAPPQVASQLFRLDVLGVLIPAGHRFAAREVVPVATLAEEPLLLGEDVQAPEFNKFVVEVYGSAGFTPTVYGDSVERPRSR
jgi:DNA-binding transcriptional LysR family regulator